MNEDLIYFDKTHALLKTIKGYITTVKAQCYLVCREEIQPETVEQEFLQFDFGFVRRTVRAVTGIRNFRKKQKEIVHSFVLCKYIHYETGMVDSINIQLLCNSKNNSYNNKDGVNLLRVVEDKCRREKIKNLTLLSLGYIALKDWYVKQGFKVLSKKNIPGTKTVKVYSMRKEL
jgi:N-acetylglutamate synthase-like GNAT family acetyltransferase